MDKALFLDRDGTINIDHGYVYKIDDFKLKDGILELCHCAQEKGYKIIVITNQSGIERGFYTIDDYEKVTQYMIDLFKSEGITITDVFSCPHLTSPDRKPNPGMFLKAKEKYNIDMFKSYSVGDKERDIEAALNAGVGHNYLLSDNKLKLSKATKVCTSLIDVKNELEKTEKILVIKHGAFGDFVNMMGWMERIREEHHDAHITLMTSSPQVKLAKASGLFNDIIIDNRTHNIFDWYRVIKKELINKSYDFIYNLQPKGRVVNRYFPIMRFFSNHNIIIRTPILWKQLLERKITKRKSFSLGKTTKHIFDIYSRASNFDFCKINKDVEDLLPKGNYVLLIPGCSANNTFKRWDPENFAKLSKKLYEKNISTVVIGTKAEESNINIIMKEAPFSVNLMCKTEMTDLPGLAKRALVCVGGDTGPTHLIIECGAKVIALFAPQKKVDARNPKALNFVGEKSINDILVDQVFDAIINNYYKE
ncbi:MAG: D-glycero-beta-D-manno-heptose 1,7-bisphosphate 7-phosphatase [Alphaproteobacteria bacterium]|nr:D-glycero-beta-D-manno-heptose 1,7-bisphosphate 7-phosphatase [Alphaproteobacteria bacterium]